MQRKDVLKLVDKDVKIILSNNFKFSGKVLKVDDETLTLFDKFESNVLIKLGDIMVIYEDKK